MPISRERFFLGHALTSNKFPSKAPLTGLGKIKERKFDLERLGFFDISSPDFSSYYPDVKPEDLNPTEADFAYSTWRALSEIIINKWGPIDFTDGVLKPSMKKLIGQSAYPNHEAMVGNEVGVIVEAAWEKSRTQDGFTIPAGINVRLKLDGKSNPKLVRGINQDPPSVHSVSVTVAFKWEKSHPELSDDEFWMKVGAYDDQGDLIRRVVTEVFSYEEISFVSHGADPYAQKVKDEGGIVNPAYADNRYQFTADDFVENGHYFDWKQYATERVSLSQDPTIPSSFKNNNNSTNKHDSMKFTEAQLKFFREQLGLAATATEAEIIAKLQEVLPTLLTAQSEVTRLTTELGTANTSLTALKTKYPEGTELVTPENKAKLAGYDAQKAVADDAIRLLREDALKLYHLTVGGSDKADAAVTKLISEASYETATALKKQYETIANKDFPQACEECGSHKVSRASSAPAEAGVQGEQQSGAGKTTKLQKEKSNAEVMEELSKRKNDTASIHGVIAQS